MPSKSPFRVFVSHIQTDLPLAKAVRTTLNNAFGGDIEFFLASEELVGGAEWQREIQTQLEKTDAIISIVTGDSVSKPWIYVEWSPFWLSKKPFYVLVTPEIKVRDLIAPMQERQAVDMTDRNQVKGLLQGLHRHSRGEGLIPWEAADTFVHKIESAHLEKLDNRYRIYRSGELPQSDYERRPIAEHFYRQGDKEAFIRVASQLRDDSLKADLLLNTLRDSRFEHEEEMRIIREVSKTINGADKLEMIARELVDHGLIDTPELLALVEHLGRRNQAELRKLLVHLIERKEEDSELFIRATEMMTNMAEYRKVLDAYVYGENVDSRHFLAGVDRLSNDEHLCRLGLTMVRERLFGGGGLAYVYCKLKGRNPKLAGRLIDAVRVSSPEEAQRLESSSCDEQLF